MHPRHRSRVAYAVPGEPLVGAVDELFAFRAAQQLAENAAGGCGVTAHVDLIELGGVRLIGIGGDQAVTAIVDQRMATAQTFR